MVSIFNFKERADSFCIVEFLNWTFLFIYLSCHFFSIHFLLSYFSMTAIIMYRSLPFSLEKHRFEYLMPNTLNFQFTLRGFTIFYLTVYIPSKFIFVFFFQWAHNTLFYNIHLAFKKRWINVKITFCIKGMHLSLFFLLLGFSRRKLYLPCRDVFFFLSWSPRTSFTMIPMDFQENIHLFNLRNYG